MSEPLGAKPAFSTMFGQLLVALSVRFPGSQPPSFLPFSFPRSSTPSISAPSRSWPALHVDYKAFLLPMAIAFAVTGMSRAPALVSDIQGGYFDRLCMTPIRRSALLLGLMVADVAVISTLCLPVLAIGAIVGVRFATGLPGVLVFIGFSALWGLAFTGFPYAVALKTGSPAAVNACYVVFFPLFFLTDAVVPKQELTGWFSAIATYNPVTYLLGALRALISSGWELRGRCYRGSPQLLDSQSWVLRLPLPLFGLEFEWEIEFELFTPGKLRANARLQLER